MICAMKQWTWFCDKFLCFRVFVVKIKTVAVQGCFSFGFCWKIHLVENARSVSKEINDCHTVSIFINQSPILLQEIYDLKPIVARGNFDSLFV